MSWKTHSATAIGAFTGPDGSIFASHIPVFLATQAAALAAGTTTWSFPDVDTPFGSAVCGGEPPVPPPCGLTLTFTFAPTTVLLDPPFADPPVVEPFTMTGTFTAPGLDAFTVTGSGTLRAGWSTGPFGTIWRDDFVFEPVPEPPPWVLLAVATAVGVGVTQRRARPV